MSTDDALRQDVRLAIGDTGPITRQTPCWKCGATQPAHSCDPERVARRRLLAFARTASSDKQRETLMSEESYNGWTNYETWLVGLFLDGNHDGKGTYRAVLELARYRVGHPYALADDLKGLLEDVLPRLEGIASDLLGAAASEVNWYELAEAKLAEISES